MRDTRQPSVVLLVAALACATAGLIAAGLDATVPAVAAVSGGFTAMTAEVVRMSLPRRHADPALIARLVEQAQAGRKLAIYDRDTGLFAHWYLALRGQEECTRAARYERSLSLLIIEPSATQPMSDTATRSRIGDWIQTDLRATDIAGYLGNGRYAVVAPEADAAAVERLIGRLRERVTDVDVSTSAFPADGESFQDLWRTAAARLAALPDVADAA